MAQDGAGELREEALDQVQPRAVGRGEGELEASDRSGREPSLGFLGYVRGMIVEDQLDRRVGRIGSIARPQRPWPPCRGLAQ